MSTVSADPKDLTADTALRPWVKQGQPKKTVAVKPAVDYFFAQFNLPPLLAMLRVMGIP